MVIISVEEPRKCWKKYEAFRFLASEAVVETWRKVIAKQEKGCRRTPYSGRFRLQDTII